MKDKLFLVNGYVNKLTDLATISSDETLIYNVLEFAPFRTYMRESGDDLGALSQETDVIKNYGNLAELQSNVRKPKNGDVYTAGEEAPYTRYKAVVKGTADIKWVEDGEEEKKYAEHYGSKSTLTRANPAVDSELFYTVGSAAPYAVYGMASQWAEVGMFVTDVYQSWQALKNTESGFQKGEVYMIDGELYIVDDPAQEKIKDRFKAIGFEKPLSEMYKQRYHDQNGTCLMIREGFQLGTLELYPVKE